MRHIIWVGFLLLSALCLLPAALAIRGDLPAWYMAPALTPVLFLIGMLNDDE